MAQDRRFLYLPKVRGSVVYLWTYLARICT